MAKTFYLDGLTEASTNAGVWVNEINGDVASASVTLPVGASGNSVALQFIDVQGALGNSFGISVKANANYSKILHGINANAGIVYNYDEQSGSYDVAFLRSGAGAWQFEHSNGSSLSPTSLALPLHNTEVRNAITNVVCVRDSSIITVEIPSHGSSVGDTIRFANPDDNGFSFRGAAVQSIKQYAIVEIVDENHIKIEAESAATTNGAAQFRANSYYQFDQDIALLFDRQADGQYKIKFYDQRQGVLLLTKVETVDITKKFGILSNYSVSYFTDLRLDSDVVSDLQDRLSNVDGFSVTTAGDQFGASDLNTLLDRDSDYYTIISNGEAGNNVFTMNGVEVQEGDVVSGLDLINYNAANDADNIGSLSVADSSGQAFDVVYDGVVSRIVTEETPDAGVEDRIEDVEERVTTLESAGVAGPQGIQGEAGAAGPAGAQGAQGPAGVAGAAGVAGVAGAQGEQGPQGLAGVAGSTGATGATGAAGRDGLNGQDGAAGRDGVQGERGIAGVAGAQGVAGTDGAQGIAGVAGVAGVAGPQGAQGIQGAAGDDFNGDARLLLAESKIACLEGKVSQLLTQLNQANLLSGNGVNFSVNCD